MGQEPADQAARQRLVEHQLRRRGVRDARILHAFATVPRAAFVPPGQRAAAYADRALPIACGQTISQPIVVAQMTELLALTGTERVLEIGTGSGYQTAILAQLARHVYSIEQHAPLSEQAARTLQTLGYHNVTLRVGDGTLGWPDEAPFDAILVAAAAPTLPEPLLEQLAPGGRLVLPLGGQAIQDIVLVRRDAAGHWHRTRHGRVRFVPLTGRHGW